MGLYYYDSATDRQRIKPRYLYAAIGFALGALFGVLLPHLI